jgi:hypothetical protein
MIDNASQPAASLGCSRWLAALTGTLTIIEAGAAVHSLYIAPGAAAQVSLSIPLEFTANVAWAVVSAFVTFALVRRKQQSVHYAAWLVISFIGYSLARLLIFARADYDHQRLPFLFVAAFIVLLIPTTFILRPVRVAAHPTENSGNGRKPKD